MKFYGMIKAFDRAANARVNPIVALEVSDDADWPEFQREIDRHCAERGLEFIAFYPYGPTERGKQRLEEYQAEQARKPGSVVTPFVIGAVALLAALALTSPVALADDMYQCADGGTMTYVEATRDMIIRRPGEADVALPFAGAASRFATWSKGGQGAVGEEVAPYAQYWQPARGPAQVWHELVEGERVDCSEAD